MELRIVGSTLPPRALHQSVEPRVRKLRSARQWHITVCEDPTRGPEITASVIVERKNPALRLDNRYLAWQRIVHAMLPKAIPLERHTWVQLQSSPHVRVWVDVRHSDDSYASTVEGVIAQAKQAATESGKLSWSDYTTPLSAPKLPEGAAKSTSAM
jgi:hypothetical protein